MDLSKKFSETRRIEHIIFKMSPKEKYVLDQYVKEMGISNKSDWIRRLVFENIDIGIKQNSLFVS